MVCEVKALACQLPSELGIPLSRFSREELRRELLSRGITAEVSGATIWRWLSEDAIRPWTRKSWIFPRDPRFREKAGRVLDLYHGLWKGRKLRSDEFVLCADEKSGLQIRRRLQPSRPPGPARVLRVEHEYERLGTCAYQVVWDVRHARLFGHAVERSTIVTFDALVARVMSCEPYHSAPRVFWVVDNGTIHRGQRSIDRLQGRWENLVLVHLPVHASWLNQVEIYLSILARKGLTPDDFASFEAIQERILGFQAHYQTVARPFEWKFTRRDLGRLLAKISTPQTFAA